MSSGSHSDYTSKNLLQNIKIRFVEIKLIDNFIGQDRMSLILFVPTLNQNEKFTNLEQSKVFHNLFTLRVLSRNFQILNKPLTKVIRRETM